MFEIAADRKALITGGASGFGLGLAKRLLELGCRVAIADVNEERLSAGADAVGRKALSLMMDVTVARSVQQGVRDVVEAFGGLDTVVNCAGICRIRPFEETTEDEWDLVMDVNLKGTFLVCQAAMPHLRQSGRGRVVNLSSVVGKRGSPLQAPYVSSKFAVIGLTQSLALEYAHDGVNVNAVLPSNTPGTGMGHELLDRKLELGWGESAEDIISRTARYGFPLGRVGTVEDTVNAILFLLSEGASFITGHSLVVDGGSLLPGPSLRQGKD